MANVGDTVTWNDAELGTLTGTIIALNQNGTVVVQTTNPATGGQITSEALTLNAGQYQDVYDPLAED